MEKKRIIKENIDLGSDPDFDKGLEAYKKMLERQRKWIEEHPNAKVAYFVPPKKEDIDD